MMSQAFQKMSSNLTFEQTFGNNNDEIMVIEVKLAINEGINFKREGGGRAV